jgi:DNA-binding transcriptional MerR regulator
MSGMELTEELAIGRFSRLSGLTVKALRHYDEIGLLEPARVDEATGYRYYSLAQARHAEAIRRLRALELPLDEIRGLLLADDATLRERLAVHRARVEGKAVETQRILEELDRLIDGREPLVPKADDVRIRFEMNVKETPERRVALVRNRVRMDDMQNVVPREIDRVAHAIGMRHAGPPFLRCPFPDPDGFVEAEIGWPVTEDTEVQPPAEAATYPSVRALVYTHVGPYGELHQAYRLMTEVMEQNGLRATDAPVEWYESDPQEVADPKDYVTVIEWPIGPEGQLQQTSDVFEKHLG